MSRPELEERFWSKVDWSLSEDRCWPWLAAEFPRTRYGAFNINGSACYAHRVAYELEVGEIPEGLVIDHICDNRKCVNPDHLRAVTQQENILRGTSPSAANAKKLNCPQCGGPYQATRKGRMCRPCETAKERGRRHARKAGMG